MAEPIKLNLYDNSDFDRGASRLKEFLWVIVRGLFFLPSWPFPSKFRVGLLRLFGATVGQGVVIRSRVNISFPWRLTIGDHCWIGEEVVILSLANVTLGSHVCLSQRSFLCTGSHDFGKPTFDLVTLPITINNHSWIAAQTFVCPGTEIPFETMVGPGQVVSSKTFHKLAS